MTQKIKQDNLFAGPSEVWEALPSPLQAIKENAPTILRAIEDKAQAPKNAIKAFKKVALAPNDDKAKIWSDKKEICANSQYQIFPQAQSSRELIKAPFTKAMKATHTILVPTMLPIHFRFLVKILQNHGYKAELLKNHGKGVVDEGVKNVHNDTCYPALLVIGQMIDALKSGEWDLHKVALLITQTGGGCRASNYIHLLRKALVKAGFGFVPVISLNFSGLEADSGFEVSKEMLKNLLSAVIYGDLLMCISNQCKPYELNKGDTDKMLSRWVERICDPATNEGLREYKALKRDTKAILKDFASIPMKHEKKVK